MLLTAVTYTASYSIAANNALILTATDFGISTPDGYTPACLINATSGNNNVMIRGFAISGSVLMMRNITGSAITGTATIRILYVKYGRFE